MTALAWPALRTLPFRTDYYRRLRTLSFENVESIIFDQMLPRIANYWTFEDMGRLVGRLEGGSPVLKLVEETSWHARVTKTGGASS